MTENHFFRRGLGISSIDALLAALAVWFVISWLATGRDPAGLALIARTVPYAMLYAGLRILLSIRDGRQFPYSFAWIVLSRGDGILVELFQILKDDALKVLHSCQQIWKTQQ